MNNPYRESAAPTPYDRLVDACHEAAADQYGPGTNISVDPEGKGFVCRVWNPRGGLALIGPENQKNKAEAFRALKKVLIKANEKDAKRQKIEAAALRAASATPEAACECDHVLDEHSKTGECQATMADGDDYCPCAAFESKQETAS